ncbi:DUF58 domain-containing protein [Leptospira sp. GIMC2001]|uniref:DUF58 domain-containing protein n=1 Tax=Leptospira sp. GIMC2001 TaxID=1513297 RepID=UPI00234B2E25|nr:DUF58 domain-containing protein [Leptospira sp. GIMC2001]WCL47619.1 DUF58 domain-containing protein [Leptospira sp. GIMC2001]
MNYLNPSFYRLVSLLEARSRKWIHGRRDGGSHFHKKGRGMEFRDVRNYISGDDIRLIDWNVTSRTGEIHIKEFYQERDIPVIIFLDLSTSMLIDSRKSDLCFQLTLLIALLHNQSNNRVQIMGFTNRWEFIKEPIKSKVDFFRQAKLLQEKILTLKVGVHPTNFALPFQFLQDRAMTRNLVYIISDFANFPETDRLLPVTRRHEINALFINSESQDLTQLQTLFALKNSESSSLATDTIPTYERDLERLQKLFGRNLNEIRSDGDWVGQLLRIFGDGL